MWSLDRLTVADLPLWAAEGDLRLGAVGLALGASAGAWLERVLLGRALRARLPGFAPARRDSALRALLALAAVIPASGALVLARGNHPTLVAVAVFGALGTGYLAAALAFGLPEAKEIAGRIFGRRRTRT
jgi:hypothetical protein